MWNKSRAVGGYVYLWLIHADVWQKPTQQVAQLCSTFCDPMDFRMPGLFVHHKLPEFTQIHNHRVGDAIQPSHALSSPPPPAFNLSQHQGFFFTMSQFFA